LSKIIPGPDRFSPEFHEVVGFDGRLTIWLCFLIGLNVKDVATATSFTDKISKIGPLTFIRHPRIPTWIKTS